MQHSEQQSGEPSVEEILESIKKVIARENGPISGPFASRRRAPAETIEPAGPDEAEEVLELDEDTMVALAEEAEGEEAHGNDRVTMAEDAPLTAEDTSASMRENFAALAMLSQPGRQPQIVRSGETSLEELTRELLRPMLSQWLDENLPGMVEDLVKAEIARIAGKKH